LATSFADNMGNLQPLWCNKLLNLVK